MRCALLVVLAVLAAATTPARADTTWTEPAPVTTEPGASLPAVAVAADGTTIRTWVAPDGAVRAQLDDHAPATVAESGTGTVAAAAGGRAVVAIGSQNASRAVLAQPDGTFTAPVDIGPGVPAAVAINASGAAAVLLHDAQQCRSPVCLITVGNRLASRPAGGAFGPAEELPGGSPVGLTLDPDGDALAVTGSGDVTATPRPAGGPLGAPVTLLAAGATDAAVATDARGRSLVAWVADGALARATRGADGAWSAPAPIAAPAPAGTVAAGTGDDGQALIAWRDARPGVLPSYGGPVRAVAGALGGGDFSAPALVDGDGFGGPPTVTAAADGSAEVVYTDAFTQAVRVARRAGGGPFGAPQVAGCHGRRPDVAVAGPAAIRIGAGLVRDTGVPGPPRVCRVGETGPAPTVAYSARPVVAGEPVTITANVRRPDFDLGATAFDFGDDGTFEVHADGNVARWTFARPGRQSFAVASRQTARYDGADVPAGDVFAVDVFARASLAATRVVRRRALRRRGLRVRGTAFAAAARPVRLRLVRRGRVLAERATRMGPVPVRRRLAPVRAPRGRAAVVLRQGGRVVARRAVRVR